MPGAANASIVVANAQLGRHAHVLEFDVEPVHLASLERALVRLEVTPAAQGVAGCVDTRQLHKHCWDTDTGRACWLGVHSTTRFVCFLPASRQKAVSFFAGNIEHESSVVKSRAKEREPV